MSDTAAPTSLSTTFSDLTLAPGTQQSALDDARKALAVAAITGQTGALFTRPSIGTAPPPAAATLTAFNQIVTQLAATHPAAQTVVRRDYTTSLSPDPRVTVVPGGGEAITSTLGPFLDAFGRPVLIDTFTVATLIGIERTGATQPVLLIESPPLTGQSDSVTLSSGSV